MSPWPAPERRDWRPASGILRPREVALVHARHPAWSRHGQRLTRALKVRDHPDALRWVDRIATEVDHFGRHPDLAIVDTNRVVVSVANPNHAGVTTAEVALIEQVDRLVARECGSAMTAVHHPTGAPATPAAEPRAA